MFQLRQQLKSELGKEASGEMGDEPPAKKGKSKLIYGKTLNDLNIESSLDKSGIDNDKWHKAKKARPEATAAISAVNAELDFTRREEVYKNHREEITAEFRSINSFPLLSVLNISLSSILGHQRRQFP